MLLGRNKLNHMLSLNLGLAPEESKRKKLPKQNRRPAFGTTKRFMFSILHLMEMNNNPHYLVAENGIVNH